MPEPRIRIVNDDGRGFMTKVFIDGQDMSECFSGVKVSAGTTGGLDVELDVVASAVDVCGGSLLRTSDATRELLIQHGWTPPAEPVLVPVETRHAMVPSRFEPLVPGLFADDEPVNGHEVVQRFYERLSAEWEPGEDDRFTVSRVYDDTDQVVPGKTRYTLAVTLDNAELPDDTDIVALDLDGIEGAQ